MHCIFLTRLPASHVFGFEIHVAGRWLQSFPDEDGWRGMMQWYTDIGIAVKFVILIMIIIMIVMFDLLKIIMIINSNSHY